MPWETVPCHPSVRLFLLSSLQKGMLGGTHLLYGPAGAGQRDVGRAIAMTLNCPQAENDFCGECSCCRRIAQKVFPDVFELRPDEDWSDEKRQGRDYSIGHMRAVQQTAQSQPYEGEQKIFLIDRAERMTLEAANCLLKLLEEPYPHALFFLLSENINRMLPTILSRCRKVRLSQLPVEQVIQKLAGDFPQQQAEALARAAGGYPQRARVLAEEGYLTLRDEILHWLLEMKQRPSRAHEAAEAWNKQKDRLPLILRILMSLLRDGLAVSANGPYQNVDQGQSLESLWGDVPAQSLIEALDNLFDAQKSLERYANPALILADCLNRLFPAAETHTPKTH